MRNLFCKLWLILMLLLPMAVMATPTYGIAHFGQSSNFDAYSMGNGKIHFKILIYGKGNEKDGYAGNANDISEAYAWTKIGEASPVPFLYYHARDPRNHVGLVANTPADQAVAFIRVLEGVLVVTNVYEGDPIVFNASDSVHEVLLSRTQVTDNKAYLEFDWYPPVRLENSSFIAGVHSKAYTGDHGTQRTDVYNLGSFTYNGDQQPQLMDPVFYPVSNNGSKNYGYLAVPYISFQQIYQYYTSWNASPIPCTDQGGMFSVKSTDCVQHGFYVVMQTKVAYLSEELHLSRKWATVIACAATMLIGAFASLSVMEHTPFTIDGHAFNDFLDFLTANIMLPLGGLLIVIFLGWRLGKTDFFAEVTNEGALKVPLKSAIFFIIRYLAPLAILVVFISGLFN